MNWGNAVSPNGELANVRGEVDDLLGTEQVADPFILTYSMIGEGDTALQKAGNLTVGYLPHVSLGVVVGGLGWCVAHSHPGLAGLMAFKTITSLHNVAAIAYRYSDRPYSLGNPILSGAKLLDKISLVNIDVEGLEEKSYTNNLFVMHSKYASEVGLPHAYGQYALEREGVLDTSLRRGLSHASDYALHRESDLENVVGEHMQEHFDHVKKKGLKSSKVSKYATAMHLHEKDKGSDAFDEVLDKPEESVLVADELVSHYLPKLA